jgi:signal transduction histidine kinase
MNKSEIESHTERDFDRDFGLDELLKNTHTENLIKQLGILVGQPVCIIDTDGNICAGSKKITPKQKQPLNLDFEPVGYLVLQDRTEKIEAAAKLVELVLKSAARYIMTSDLHIQAVQTDYEVLQEKHQKLEKSERQYRDLTDNLERRVQQQVKTIESSQRQLYQVEKMSSLGQLAAGIAHEINNPIGFIQSNLGTAEQYMNKFKKLGDLVKEQTNIEQLAKHWQEEDLDFVTEDFSTLLNESIDGVARVTNIVKDLKDFSNVDRNEYSLCNLNDIITNVCNVSSHEINKKAKIQLQFGDISLTYCQPCHLGQVFLNILLNATQAMQQPGEITVSTKQEKNKIITILHDNGPGIAEAVLQRVFEPFYTTKEVGQGTGLGLTVCRDIVQAHNGDVSLESVQGQGTTVTITLPVQQKSGA